MSMAFDLDDDELKATRKLNGADKIFPNNEVKTNIDKVTRFLNSLLLLSNKFNLYIGQSFDNIVLCNKNEKVICNCFDFTEDFYSCFYQDNNVSHFITSDDLDDTYDTLNRYYVDKDEIREIINNSSYPDIAIQKIIELLEEE